MNAEDATNTIIEESAEALTGVWPGAIQIPLGPQWVRVINTPATGRHDLAELMIATDERTRGLRVLDSSSNEVPCQVVPTRRYLPEPLRAATSHPRKADPTHDPPLQDFGEEMLPLEFAALDQPADHSLLRNSGESLTRPCSYFGPRCRHWATRLAV
jgi:hypothetical protein